MKKPSRHKFVSRKKIPFSLSLLFIFACNQSECCYTTNTRSFASIKYKFDQRMKQLLNVIHVFETFLFTYIVQKLKKKNSEFVPFGLICFVLFSAKFQLERKNALIPKRDYVSLKRGNNGK